MVLPAPKLDDRSFQDLVNETKRQIPRFCPEWTDHNVSDPGVTLIELFAYMVDIMLYRVNRVPVRNYIKWLEMLGIRLTPPRPARADLTLYLVGPQPEAVAIPAGTQAGTVRTESQQSIVFATDEDLTIQVPTLLGVFVNRGGRTFHDYVPAILNPALNVGIFQDPPQPNDSMYFGYHEDLRGHILQLTLDSRIEGIGVNPDDPPLAWECWDEAAEEWGPVFLESDTTGGLNRAGTVVVHVPFNARPRDLDGHVGFWIRCRATSPRPNQPAYSAAPRVRKVETVSLGGIVPASQVAIIEGEVLGRSTGLAGQEWPLSTPPILERRTGEILQVEDEDGTFVPWIEVADWAEFGAAGAALHARQRDGRAPLRAARARRGRARGALWGHPARGAAVALQPLPHGRRRAGQRGQADDHRAEVVDPVHCARDQRRPGHRRDRRREHRHGDAARAAGLAGAHPRRHGRGFRVPGPRGHV